MLKNLRNNMMFLFLFGILIFINNVTTLNTQNEKLSTKFLGSMATDYSNTSENNFQAQLNNIKSSLFITGDNDKSALINLKIKNTNSIFSIGLFQKEFVLMSKGDTKLINVNPYKAVNISGNSIMTNSIKVNGQVKFNEIPQWRMVLNDNFAKNNTNLEWNFQKTTECNFHKILGGHCQISKKELEKEINNLPSHKMVRIEANFHFLGSWDSHTGYLKIDFKKTTEKNEKIIWAQRCKNMKSPLANVKMCQDLDISICKIGVPISSTINHSENSLKLIFGSTLNGNPCDQSYGISDLKIYIR